MWANDKKALAKLLGAWGTESHGAVPPILNANYAELRKAGHYRAAMLHYGGEWYWGIDRLPLPRGTRSRATSAATSRTSCRRGRRPIAAPRSPSSPSKAKPLACELWFSFRSPYSYLALEQIEAVLAPYKVPLVLRPVAADGRRAACRCRPSSGCTSCATRSAKPIASASRSARSAIRSAPASTTASRSRTGPTSAAQLLAFAKSAMRGIWAEARDMTEYVDLRYVVERAEPAVGRGARSARRPRGARKWAHANGDRSRRVSGCGACRRSGCGDFVAWGQDRLPLLADRLRRANLRLQPQLAVVISERRVGRVIHRRRRSAMSEATNGPAVVDLVDAGVPADQGLSSLGMFMQLAGNVFAALRRADHVHACCSRSRHGGGDETLWMFLILGLSIGTLAAPPLRRRPAALRRPGDPGRPHARRPALHHVRARAVGDARRDHQVQVRRTGQGRVRASSSASRCGRPLLAGLLALPRFRRFKDELPLTEDKGFEGASILMTVLGLCGLIGVGTVLIVMLKMPARELQQGPGVLLVLVARACSSSARSSTSRPACRACARPRSIARSSSRTATRTSA